LKARSLAILARLSKISIDDVNPRHRPPQRDRPLHQGILIALAFAVAQDLLRVDWRT
jgi:hypothetical protein